MKSHRRHYWRSAVIGVAAAASTIGVYHLSTQVTKEPLSITQTSKVGPAELYPNPFLTPGATNPDIDQSNISQNICNSSWSTKSIRPPVSYTNQLKAKEIAAGYIYNGDTNSADYELDHFISLELGGNPTSEQNLWPEPYHTQISGSEVGAHQKDLVENLLHKQVCQGTITLQQAQEEITTDWYKVFIDNNL